MEKSYLLSSLSCLVQVACPNVNFDFNGAVLQDCSTSCNNIVVHDCLSFGGQSGSPIFSTSGTDNYTVTLHLPPLIKFALSCMHNCAPLAAVFPTSSYSQMNNFNGFRDIRTLQARLSQFTGPSTNDF